MTGSHLMTYSPVASLGMLSSFHSSNSDHSFRSSFDKERSELSSKPYTEFSTKTASLASQRSETYSEVNRENTADLVGIKQVLHSAPCGNSENNQNDMPSSACISDHETMKKLGELKDAFNHSSAVSFVGDGKSRWRNDWMQVMHKNAKPGPSLSGQIRQKFVWPSDVGGSVDICRIRSGNSNDVNPGNRFWQPVENIGATVTEHERKKVSFKDGFSWSGYSAGEGETMVHNVKFQNPSHSHQVGGINETNSQSGREFRSTIDSASFIKRWLYTNRLSATQSREPFDYFPNANFTPVCPQSKSTTSLRRKTEPLYLHTMVAKWSAVEELDSERNGGETHVESRNRSFNRSSRSLSENYLLHLKNTERISKHVEYIIKKYGLDLLDDHTGDLKYEDFGRCLEFANVSANNNNVDDGQPQGATSSGGPAQQGNRPEEKYDDQKETRSKGFSLRRPFHKAQKKTGSLDKSRSLVGPGLDKSCHEDASPRRPVSPALQTKDNESSFVESSEQKAVSSIEGKMKKPYRRFSLNLFRKTRDRFADAPSKDRSQAEFEGQGNRDYESSKQAEDVGTSYGYDHDAIENAETARGKASKIISPKQQQKLKLNCLEHLQDQTQLMSVSETVSMDVSCDIRQDKNKKRKTESKKELSSKISNVSVSSRDASAKSSHVIVPLEAKTSLVFHDAVFYFPSEDKAGCDDENSELAVSRSESKVPRPSKSSSLRVPAKVAISDAKDQGMIERRPSILKRMRAFFGRSSSTSGSYNVGQASSSSLLDTSSVQDKERRGIEEWRWSGVKGQGNTGPVRESSSSTDLEKSCLLSKSQQEHEMKAGESVQREAVAEELIKNESELKDN